MQNISLLLRFLLCLTTALCQWPVAAPAGESSASWAIELFRYGGAESDVIHDALPLADGGFLLAGCTLSNDGDVSGRVNTSTNYCDAWAVRTGSDGTIQWQLLIGEDDNTYEEFTLASQRPDGSYALVYCAYNGNGIWYQIVVVDDNGDIVERIAPPAGIGSDIRQSDSFTTLTWHALDDGYLAVERVGLDEDARTGLTTIARLDFEGNILWRRSYPLMTPWSPGQVTQAGDTLLFSGIWREGLEFVGCAVKMDADGNVLWKYAAGEPDGFEHFHALCALPDGGAIVTGGKSPVNASASEQFLLRLSPDGNLIWRHPLANNAGGIAKLLPYRDGILAFGSSGNLTRYDLDGHTEALLEFTNTRYKEVQCVVTGADGHLYRFASTANQERGDCDITVERILPPVLDSAPSPTIPAVSDASTPGSLQSLLPHLSGVDASDVSRWIDDHIPQRGGELEKITARIAEASYDGAIVRFSVVLTANEPDTALVDVLDLGNKTCEPVRFAKENASHVLGVYCENARVLDTDCNLLAEYQIAYGRWSDDRTSMIEVLEILLPEGVSPETVRVEVTVGAREEQHAALTESLVLTADIHRTMDSLSRTFDMDLNTERATLRRVSIHRSPLDLLVTVWYDENPANPSAGTTLPVGVRFGDDDSPPPSAWTSSGPTDDGTPAGMCFQGLFTSTPTFSEVLLIDIGSQMVRIDTATGNATLEELAR